MKKSELKQLIREEINKLNEGMWDRKNFLNNDPFSFLKWYLFSEDLSEDDRNHMTPQPSDVIEAHIEAGNLKLKEAKKGGYWIWGWKLENDMRDGLWKSGLSGVKAAWNKWFK